MYEAFTMFGASFTLIMLLMIALWVVYLVQRNAGIVDIGWGVSFLLASWAYFLLGHGDFLKMSLVTAMVTIWGVRLISYLYMRYDALKEDSRYTRLREKWGGDPNDLLFLMMFVFQGLLVIIISLPIFLINYSSTYEWSKWEFIGIALWAAGVIGEWFADTQLAEFKKDPLNKDKVCQVGLWRYSRHPNFFFEFVVWIGFFLFALPSTGGLFGVIAPIVVFLLLVKGSGIPLTEEQALVTKGEKYQEYQRTTSAFFPWFPKK